MIHLPPELLGHLKASTERQTACVLGGGHHPQHVTDGIDPADGKFKHVNVCLCGYVQVEELAAPEPLDFTVIPRCIGCGVYLDMPPPWRIKLGNHHSCLGPKCIRRLVRELGPDGIAMASIVMALAESDKR